jgi:hypothetical protein
MAYRPKNKSGRTKAQRSAASSADRAGSSGLGKARAVSQSKKPEHFQKYDKWTSDEFKRWKGAYKASQSKNAERLDEMRKAAGRAAYKRSRGSR